MIFFESTTPKSIWVDRSLLMVSVILLSLGLVMISSSSLALAEQNIGDPLYYLKRQTIFAVLGLSAAVVCYFIPPQKIQENAVRLMWMGIALLVLVLIPSIGQVVNGSRRWINLGLFALQASELAKLFSVIYFSHYIARHYKTIAGNLKQFLILIAVTGVIALLLLLEPDYGATVVIMAIMLAMAWLAKVRYSHFFATASVLTLVMTVLVMVSPYRWQRLMSFPDPWQDRFGSGYQLTQSLIAIGSGGWFGSGLGDSIQKLFYLPEPHTDFIFSIIAEELGFAGVVVVVVLFWLFLHRCFVIGKNAEQEGLIAGAYYAYGIGVWFGLQAFINMAVSSGIMPTKGITLPLISYGGSSLIVSLAAIGLLMRVYHETRLTTGISTYRKVSSKVLA